MKVDPHKIIEDILNDGYCITKIAYGDSMMPTIPSGAVLNICPVVTKQIRRGDIVLFKTISGKTLIHRVSRKLKRKNDLFIQTWADNSLGPDLPVSGHNVIGLVISFKVGNKWEQIKRGLPCYLYHFIKRYGLYYSKRLYHKALQFFTDSILCNLN